MKVEWRKVCDLRERVETDRLIEILIDIREHPMHPDFVF